MPLLQGGVGAKYSSKQASKESFSFQEGKKTKILKQGLEMPSCPSEDADRISTKAAERQKYLVSD